MLKRIYLIWRKNYKHVHLLETTKKKFENFSWFFLYQMAQNRIQLPKMVFFNTTMYESRVCLWCPKFFFFLFDVY